ncbi:MAG: BlaI/MecI/CopY family transcriptional regulator [Planctomycetaceae bacterium]
MANDESQIAISPAEWEIMKVLWQHGDMAARDVYATLPDDSEWAYKTVKTLLSRLVAKRAITYDQIGNSYLYRAIADESTLTRQEVRSVFQRISRGALSPVLAHFIEEAQLSKAEIEQLRKTLERKRPAKEDVGEKS